MYRQGMQSKFLRDKTVYSVVNLTLEKTGRITEVQVACFVDWHKKGEENVTVPGQMNTRTVVFPDSPSSVI